MYHNNSFHNKYFGKYRGIVIDNKDPNLIGRVKCIIPDVLGESVQVWCNLLIGFHRESFFIPNIGDEVYIEFESGDPNRPICVGRYITANKVPLDMNNNYPDKFGIVGTNGEKILFDDKEQSIEIFSQVAGRVKLTKDSTIEVVSPSGASIVIENTGNIKITSNANCSIDVAGNISLQSSGNVDIQGTASISISSSGAISISGSTVNLG